MIESQCQYCVFDIRLATCIGCQELLTWSCMAMTFKGLLGWFNESIQPRGSECYLCYDHVLNVLVLMLWLTFWIYHDISLYRAAAYEKSWVVHWTNQFVCHPILGGLPLRWWKIKELTYYLLVYGVLYIHKTISVNKKFVNGNSWVAYRTSTLYCLVRLTILWFACGDRLGYNMIFSKYSQCTTSNWKLLSGSVSNRLFRLSAKKASKLCITSLLFGESIDQWIPCTQRGNNVGVSISWSLHDKSSSAAVDTLWPSDTIWQCRSRSALAQVMTCCLTMPSHYLNQYWQIISEVLFYSQLL